MWGPPGGLKDYSGLWDFHFPTGKDSAINDRYQKLNCILATGIPARLSPSVLLRIKNHAGIPRLPAWGGGGGDRNENPLLPAQPEDSTSWVSASFWQQQRRRERGDGGSRGAGSAFLPSDGRGSARRGNPRLRHSPPPLTPSGPRDTRRKCTGRTRHVRAPADVSAPTSRADLPAMGGPGPRRGGGAGAGLAAGWGCAG